MEIIGFTEQLSTTIQGVFDEGAIYSIIEREFKKSGRYTAIVLLLTGDGLKLKFRLSTMASGPVEMAEKVVGARLMEYEVDLRRSKLFSQVALEGKTFLVGLNNILEDLLPLPAALLIAKISGLGKRESIMTPLYKHGKIVGVFATSSTELGAQLVPSVKNLARNITIALERADEYAERERAVREIRSLARFPSEDPNPVLRIADNGEIVYANQASNDLLAKWERGIGDIAPDRWLELTAKAVSSGEGQTAEVELGDRVLLMNIVPVPGSECINVYGSDITDRKKMEQALKDNAESLERLVEERTRELREAERLSAIGEVAAAVGHDLRNPLQAVVNDLYSVKTKLETLPASQQKGAVEQSFVETIRKIEQQVEYMNNIISELQDLARPVSPRLTETDLLALLRDVIASTDVPANISIRLDAEHGQEFTKSMADGVMMRRVFSNMITNAIQAMPSGGHLVIEAAPRGENLSVGFRDDGVGMTKETLDKLFRPLFTTKSKGQGLGLATCKRLVEAQGGSITVESQVGEGTTFTVNVPLRK